MIKTSLLTAAALAIAASSAVPAGAQPVTGNWLTKDNRAIVAIGRCGNTICGEIRRVLVETPEDDQRDSNNPDPALRNRPIEGARVLTGFRRNGDRYRGGEIYDPENGRTYNARLELVGADRLKVTGCVLGGIICRSQYWTRR